MKFAVVVFPGFQLRSRRLPRREARARPGRRVRLAQGHEPRRAPTSSILPGGFAHGDYLRTGAIARFSPIMAAVARVRRARGGPVLGICNGFQILLEAGCCRARCCATATSSSTASTSTSGSSRPTRRSPRAAQRGQVLRIPIAHGEGNYYAEPEVDRRARARPAACLPLLRRARARSPTRRTRTAR